MRVKRRLPRSGERAEALQQRFKAEKDVKRGQRLQMLYLLASGQARTRQQVAVLLGVYRHSVRAWLVAYEAGGVERMLTYRVPIPSTGRRITPPALAALQERLADPKGFASYGQIQRYLAQ
jgi:hypothetical protein